MIDKIKLSEDKEDNDEFVELIKRYVIDEDIEFDVAKNLITEFLFFLKKSKNGPEYYWCDYYNRNYKTTNIFIEKG